MKKISFLIFLFLFNNSLHAQYCITGKVIDKEKEPIPGANIIFAQNDSLRGMTMTDKDGKWAIDELRKGEYQLTISFIGYTPIEHKVFITKNMNMDFI